MKPDVRPRTPQKPPRRHQQHPTPPIPTNPAGIQPLPPPAMSVPPDSPKQTPKTSKLKLRSRSAKTIFIALVLLLAAVILFMVSTIVWYQSQLRPLSDDEAAYQIIHIPKGAGTGEIADTLEQQHIIRNSRAFTWYVRLNNTGTLQAGDYRLSSQQSVAEIVTIVSEGKVNTVDVLIPPGVRLDQIKAILVKSGYDKLEIDDALMRVRDHALLKEVPRTALLEGYLFPDTYRVSPQTDAETLVRMILDNFEKQITQDITAKLAAQKITLSDAVILASIIQKEVPDEATQRIVAQVFIKRLKAGRPLGADPTFKYAAAMTGRPATPGLDSPYNTRIYTGLPPTPIANFNLSALQAVANPSNTSYNYFVSGDDGKTHFTYTLAEHEAATRKYCSTLCE